MERARSALFLKKERYLPTVPAFSVGKTRAGSDWQDDHQSSKLSARQSHSLFIVVVRVY